MLPRLEIDNLSCGRGERALFSGLSFVLEAGDVARILGANGSGKTTLLRTIGGMYRTLAGAVRWHATPSVDGDDAPSALQQQLCFIAHDNALNGALTPFENLDTLMRLAGRRVAAHVVRDTLTELGLKRVAHQACDRLSAGQKRRVSLARLWLSDAPLWLLDEPASALDVESRAVLATRITAHVESGGLVLFTTHEQLELPRLSLRTIELPVC